LSLVAAALLLHQTLLAGVELVVFWLVLLILLRRVIALQLQLALVVLPQLMEVIQFSIT
jgi:hypothetical protein